MSYSKIKLLVGAFVIILFTILSSSLFFLLKEGVFEERYSYHFSTLSASSFKVGMPLHISGFNIGTIDDIFLLDDGSVDVTFSISKKNKKWLLKDSVIILNKPLIGSPNIELFSAIGNEPLPVGGELAIELSADINDVISKLEPAVEKMVTIISSIEIITSSMSKSDSDLMKTFKNMERLTSNLSKNESLLTTITGDKSSTQSLINSLDEIAKIMKDISNLTSSLDANIITPSSSLLNELNAIMKDVKQKLEALDSTVKAVGSYDTEIIDIKEQVSTALQKSNQIMDKVDALMQDEKKSEVTLP